MQLRNNNLIFKTSCGEQIPCSAEWVTLELMGDAAINVEPQVIHNATAAVLHYFQEELQRTYVSISEFADALEKVLRGLGFDVVTEPESPKIAETDLRHLVSGGSSCELFFFASLREQLNKKLKESPQIVAFRGLRGCVKSLLGAQRWSNRCQLLNDQIVDYLRNCWNSDCGSDRCAMVVL
jgi:hypothetical protein